MKCKKCGNKVAHGISAFTRTANQCDECGCVVCTQCLSSKNSFTKTGECPFCGGKTVMMR